MLCSCIMLSSRKCSGNSGVPTDVKSLDADLGWFVMVALSPIVLFVLLDILAYELIGTPTSRLLPVVQRNQPKTNSFVPTIKKEKKGLLF